MQPLTRNEIDFIQKWLRRIADQITANPPCEPTSASYSTYLHKTGYGWFSNAANAMEWALDLPMYGGTGEKDKAEVAEEVPEEEIDNAGIFVDTTGVKG
jgi:hypothetical protein